MNGKTRISREWKIIIIVLSVILLGTLGFIYWDSFRQIEPVVTKDDDTADVVVPETPNIDTDVTPIPEVTAEEEQPSTASANVFAIPQWNIQGDYVVNHPAEYEIVVGGEALFTSSDLTDNCVGFTVASVFRRTGDQLISSIGNGFVGLSGAETVSDYYLSHTAGVSGDIKHIGEYYYIFVTPQTTCYQTGSTKADATVTRVATDLYSYFATFKAIEL